ncbi:hypothetical protein [Halomarina litorea]|nr:hypothetical protein [Halomarina sp. BCD28]
MHRRVGVRSVCAYRIGQVYSHRDATDEGEREAFHARVEEIREHARSGSR